MVTISCPKCGSENLVEAMNCKECRINLEWAKENYKEHEQEKIKWVELEQVKVKREHSGKLIIDKSFKLVIQVSIGYSVFVGILLIVVWISERNFYNVGLGLFLVSNIFFGVMALKLKRWGIYGILSVLLLFFGNSLGNLDYFYILLTFPLIYLLYIKFNSNQNDRLARQSNIDRKRGWVLTGIILAMIIHEIYNVVFYRILWVLGVSKLIPVMILYLLVLSMVELATIFFGLVIWKWKKWGIYGAIACSLVKAGLGWADQEFFTAILVPIIQIGLLVGALRTGDKWSYFD